MAAPAGQDGASGSSGAPPLIRFGRALLMAGAAAAMFAMMTITFVDVVGRYGASRPVPGSSELIQICLALAVGSALPLVTGAGEHVCMDLFTTGIRGTARRVLDAAIMTASAGVLALLAILVWRQANALHQSRTSTLFLDIPIAPVAFAVAAMLGVACTVQLGLLATHLRPQRSGRR